MQRGSGQTSEQMKSAPRDAVFVWCNDGLRYPTDLARHLGREDLKIVGPGGAYMAAVGTTRLVVIDHAAYQLVSAEVFDKISAVALFQNGLFAA